HRLGAQARARPKVLLGVAGGLGLLLLVWSFAHRGSTAPVPYQENGRWGYADASGTPVIKAQFASAAPFEAGQAVVEQEGAFGLVDEAGQTVVAPAYDAINPYHGRFARVRVGEAYTFLEEGGQEFDHFFFNALDFAEGRAAVLDHRGWFYLSGPEVPENPPVFREAYSFVDGLARVRLADGYTFISPDYVADPASGTKPFGRYELAADFADGKARVTQKGRSFLIDKDGEEVK
ncbi:MAG: WG repeat-containing protein, partial [Bacteroidota bacterium]|nr:WG repeat-containing protein [Bacteroidota bacterium]